MNKGKEKRIAALNKTQEQRRQECLEKTEKAIVKLSQINQKLSFANIAREANVSISYLYKYPEIKDRIKYLRRQQEENAKPVKPQLRTEKSSQTVINQLKNRIKVLDADKKELTKQNEALTGRLYSLGNTQDMIARLNSENERLKNEVEKVRAELQATQKELDSCQQRLVSSNPKIASIEEKRSNKSTIDEISDELKSQINDVGIRLNKTLIKLIKSAPELQVINALSVVKEALAVGKVKSKAGLFRKALEEGWQPNKSNVEREINVIKSSFAEWYDLARSYGIVIGCREEDGVMMVQENTSNWYKFEEFSVKWTLEYLKRR
jgi:chromosome segregation ATPase